MKVFHILCLIINIIISSKCMNEKIIELSDKTIDDFLENNDNVLILFYSNNCQICENSMHHYNQIGEKLHFYNIKLAKIQNNYKEIISKYDIMALQLKYHLIHN